MTKNQIILSVAAIAVVAILFSLPRVIVSDGKDKLATGAANRDQKADTTTDTHDHEEEESHSMSLSMEDTKKIDDVRASFVKSKESIKKVIFADSLAKIFSSHTMFDSAAVYIDYIATENSSTANNLRAGEAWYQAFSTAPGRAIAATMGENARNYFGKVLKSNPGNLEVKAKMAMTYVTTDNPMQGIMMLREVLQKDPKNELATFNLGLLSMQSGQLDKAVDRFKSVLTINPGNIEAQYYLAICLKESGRTSEAKELLESIKTSASDPAIRQLAGDALQDIK